MIGHGAGVSVHALVHLVTDDVYQAIKHLLHVDVVFGTGLEELETYMGERVRGRERQRDKERKREREREIERETKRQREREREKERD